MNGIYALDVKFLYDIRIMGMHFPFLNDLAIFSAGNLIYLIPLHLLFLWFFKRSKGRRQALTIFFAIIIGLICSYFIGLIFDRPRPYIVGLLEPLILHRDSPSFPSNHALIFSAYLFCLYRFHYSLMFFIGLIFAVLTCWARIYAGIHYPFDILGGVFVGVLTAGISVNYLQKLMPNWLINFYPFYKNKDKTKDRL